MGNQQEQFSKPAKDEPIRILVADDDLSTLMIFEMFALLASKNLQTRLKGNLEITKVSSGNQALDAIHSQPFDIAIFDMNMPDTDGHEILYKLKASSESSASLLSRCKYFAMSSTSKEFYEKRGVNFEESERMGASKNLNDKKPQNENIHFSGYIQKPFKPNDIEYFIESQIAESIH